jgi:hypothetical protein
MVHTCALVMITVNNKNGRRPYTSLNDPTMGDNINAKKAPTESHTPWAKLAAAYELSKNGTMISGNVGANRPIIHEDGVH